MTARRSPFELRLFYALFFVSMVNVAAGVLTRAKPLPANRLVGVLSWLAPWFAEGNALFVLTPFFAMVGFGLCLYRPEVRIFRVLAFLSANLLVTTLFSIQGGWNDYHGLMIASFILIFINGKAGRDFLIFRLCQAMIFTHYAISGSWKLLGVFQFDTFFEAVSGFFWAPFNGLAESVGEGFGPNPVVLDLITKFPAILGISWLIVVAFQCSAFVPVFWPRFTRLWGVFAVIFHLGTGFFLDIWFPNSVLAAVYFFILYEDWIALGNYPNVPKPNS